MPVARSWSINVCTFPKRESPFLITSSCESQGVCDQNTDGPAVGGSKFPAAASKVAGAPMESCRFVSMDATAKPSSPPRQAEGRGGLPADSLFSSRHASFSVDFLAKTSLGAPKPSNRMSAGARERLVCSGKFPLSTFVSVGSKLPPATRSELFTPFRPSIDFP